MHLLLLLSALADVSVPHLGMACGTPRWQQLRDAVDAYCRSEAAPSEALGCRVAHYSFSHCEAAPELEPFEDGSLKASIRDPRDRSYAWLMQFARVRGVWTLERFKYEFDDCDAMGIPEPPRGPLRLADLRRAQHED